MGGIGASLARIWRQLEWTATRWRWHTFGEGDAAWTLSLLRCLLLCLQQLLLLLLPLLRWRSLWRSLRWPLLLLTVYVALLPAVVHWMAGECTLLLIKVPCEIALAKQVLDSVPTVSLSIEFGLANDRPNAEAVAILDGATATWRAE